MIFKNYSSSLVVLQSLIDFHGGKIMSYISYVGKYCIYLAIDLCKQITVSIVVLFISSITLFEAVMLNDVSYTTLKPRLKAMSDKKSKSDISYSCFLFIAWIKEELLRFIVTEKTSNHKKINLISLAGYHSKCWLVNM